MIISDNNINDNYENQNKDEKLCVSCRIAATLLFFHIYKRLFVNNK